MENLTKKEILTLLKKWEQICLMQDELEEILIMAGFNMDGLIYDVLYQNNNAYTNLLSEKIGINDWLDWYRYENNMGKKKYKAGFELKEKPIKTIEDLVNLIIQVRNNSKE